MAKKRTRETHEKRVREHEKETKRAQKLVERIERNAKKREAKLADPDGTAPACVGVAIGDPMHPAYEPVAPPPPRIVPQERE